MCEDETWVAAVRLIGVTIIWAPWLLYGETLTLQHAIVAAEANNRVIRAARLEHDKALREIGVARTYRLPIFSVSALGSQSLAHLGLTFPMVRSGSTRASARFPAKRRR